MIDRGGTTLSILRQCELLGLCRSSLYYRARPISEADLLLMRRLDELHLLHPFLGARRLARLLQREGVDVGRRHVGTLLRLMGIEAIYRKKRTSRPATGHRIYPYLLREVVIERPRPRSSHWRRMESVVLSRSIIALRSAARSGRAHRPKNRAPW